LTRLLLPTTVGLAILISVADLLVSSHGGAALRLE